MQNNAVKIERDANSFSLLAKIGENMNVLVLENIIQSKNGITCSQETDPETLKTTTKLFISDKGIGELINLFTEFQAKYLTNRL